jgi:hypothetical protein
VPPTHDPKEGSRVGHPAPKKRYITLQQARLKIRWADKHISKLESMIDALPDSSTATVEINPDGGNEVIKYDFGDLLNDLALMAGDAIHNLKCALDYTWLETISICVPDAVGKFAKFPVYPTQDELEGALKGKKIDIADADLFDLVVNQIKPYAEGNFAIWPIHRLNIRDKHRLLIPAVYYSSISGIETEDKLTGEISFGGHTLGTEQKPPLYIPIPMNLRVKNKGKVSVHVIFKYGSPGRDYHPADTFSLYSRYILQVVETFESFLETAGH